MGLLSSASAWLDGVRNANFAATVTYIPGGGSGFTVTATPGDTVYPSENEDGVELKVRKKDWIITASLLTVEPAPGDQIVEADGTVNEVAAAVKGENHWRWHDQNRTIYRIHTQQIAPS